MKRGSVIQEGFNFLMHGGFSIALWYLSFLSFLYTAYLFNNGGGEISAEAFALAVVFQFGQTPALFFVLKTKDPVKKFTWLMVLIVFFLVDLATNNAQYAKIATVENHTTIVRIIWHGVWSLAVIFEEIAILTMASSALHLNKLWMALGNESVPFLEWAEYSLDFTKNKGGEDPPKQNNDQKSDSGPKQMSAPYEINQAARPQQFQQKPKHQHNGQHLNKQREER